MKSLCKVYYPVQFNSDRIYYYPKFANELKNIIGKSGIFKKFAEIFERRLYFIQQDMNRCTLTDRWFEKLKEEESLYSIKFKMVKNIRVIFMFTDYSQRQIAVLLCSFEEKNNKQGSKDSYNKGIEIARKRRVEILNGFELEGEDRDG